MLVSFNHGDDLFITLTLTTSNFSVREFNDLLKAKGFHLMHGCPNYFTGKTKTITLSWAMGHVIKMQNY